MSALDVRWLRLVGDAAIDLGLAPRHDTLLVGIDERAIARLPRHVKPGAQLRSDLHELNQMPASRSCLRLWLDNAIDASGGGDDGKVFRTALELLGGANLASNEHPPGPTPFTVEVRGKENSELGSGWMLSHHGGPMLVTAFHLVGHVPTGEWRSERDADVEYIAYDMDGKMHEMPLRPLAHDDAADLALLEPVGPVLGEGLQLGRPFSAAPRPGTRWIIRARAETSLQRSVEKGTVVAVAGGRALTLRGEPDLRRPGVLVGSAVVDERGEVMGTFTMGAGSPAAGVVGAGYASSSRALAALLTRTAPGARRAGLPGGGRLLSWLFATPDRWCAFVTSLDDPGGRAHDALFFTQSRGAASSRG